MSSSLAAAGARLRRRPRTIAAAWAGTFVLVLALLLALSIRDSPFPPPPPVVKPTVSFEHGFASWRAYATATIARTSEEHAFGRASLAVRATTTRLPYGIRLEPAVRRPRPRRRYTIAASVKGTGSSVGSRAYLQIYDTRGHTLALAQTTLGSGWTRFGASGRATDRTASLNAYLWLQLARETGETFYVDGISLARRSGGKR